MRLRDAQRLIFGSLTLLLLMYLGATAFLVRAFDRPEPSASDLYPQAVTASGQTFEFPGEEAWADTGKALFMREIENYALSGTFQTFEMREGSENEVAQVRSIALVDDLREGKQRLLREGDRLGSFRVDRVSMDRVTLSRGEYQFELALSGQMASGANPVQTESTTPSAPQRFEDLPALEENRFGKKVAENQWVLKRQEVFNYAEEIMGNPLRATQLFRSFSQVAEAEGDEPGFRIQMKGEEAFFRDMGLGDGDVIRRVNSMEMKSQVRAEYLVREFMNSRMSAVVLDVENNGESRKQIFIVR
ncbi:MAG: hypothetical protein ACO3N7_03745 [Kiritimatiellia bacterium]